MNPAYLDAHFRADPPETGWPEAFGVVTACNPDGVTVSDAENEAATDALRERLVAEGWMFFPVTGGSADFTHAEPGFGIVAPRETVVALGRAFRQEAVFWIVDGELTLCPCGAGELMELGDWEERLDAETQRRVLMKEFTRAVPTVEGVSIEFNDLQWPHPSQPEVNWVRKRMLDADASEEAVEEARRTLLERRDCFTVCTMCGKLNPVGWMCGDEVCQSCASGELGVVF